MPQAAAPPRSPPLAAGSSGDSGSWPFERLRLARNSTRSATMPAGADTAAGSHPDRLEEAKGGQNADDGRPPPGAELMSDTGIGLARCELVRFRRRSGLRGECFGRIASIASTAKEDGAPKLAPC